MFSRDKRAFSLVEVVFGSIIGLMLLGVFWNIYYSQTSTSHKLTRKNEALRSSQIAMEVIQKDFRQLVSVPVERSDDGTINRKFGDHTAPAKVSPDGKSVSFYIPAEITGTSPSDPATIECYTVVYSRVPAKLPGTYFIKRSVVKSPAELTGVTDGTVAEIPGKNINSVLVKDVTFHLLDPKAPAPQYRSPDTNYYLQAVIEGTDEAGEEQMTANVLTVLEYPSVMQMTQNINEVTTYTPLAPLVTTPDTFVPTPEEENTIKTIGDLTDRFAQGSITSAQYEKEICDLINSHAGNTNGPVFASSGNIIPHIESLTVSSPPAPGQPVILSSPAGQTVVVPPPPVPSSGSDPDVTVSEGGNNWNFTAQVMVLDSNGNVRYEENAQGGGTSMDISGEDLQNMVGSTVETLRDHGFQYIENQRGTGNVSN